MTYGEVRLPAPVFTVRVECRPGSEPGWEETWWARVWCGEQVVFKRRYTDSVDWDSEHYADSEGRARERVLEEFAERVKEVLG